MRISLKSLHIENFKGIKQLDVAFGDKTNISGQNASGKTTVFDSFTWLIFNKNSAGVEKFNIRPLDSDGKQIDNVEIKVVAVLEVDGKEVELCKIQKQNWVKHRNSPAPKLDGNINSYWIDGYPKSEKDYKTYIASLIEEDLFKMLTNPLHFVSMKWKDQRNILMRFVLDISDPELARQFNAENGNTPFDALIPELEKAPSTDDIKNKFTKMLSEWEKKQIEIPVRIDELSKSLADVDVAEKELAVKELSEHISEIDAKIADAGKVVNELCGESMNLQFAMNAMRTAANDLLLLEQRKLEDARFEAEKMFNSEHRAISEYEKQIAENESTIAQAEKKRSELGALYKETSALVFDETPYLFDESKWIFDESSTVCSLCRQSLPADKIAEIKADFESRKVNAKAETEKKLEDARSRFYSKKNSELEKIKADGFNQKYLIEGLTAKSDSLRKQIEDAKKKEIELLGKKNQIEKQLKELSFEADMSGDEEYQQKKARYEELEKQIAGLKDSASVADAFREERKALVAELDSVKTDIAKASKNVEIEERIGELEEEQKEVAQKVADQEKMLYLLEEFIKAKMLRISDSINQHFNTVNFKLFEMQLNGGTKECCECTVNGVPFSTLNSGHRIIAGLDIIRSLSGLYSVNPPIFTDNAESINEYNIPEMDAQMILLSVSADKELKVEVAE